MVNQIQGSNETPQIHGESTSPKLRSSSSGEMPNNMAGMKEFDPEAYHQMLVSMANDINNKSRKHQEKIHKINQEGNN